MARVTNWLAGVLGTALLVIVPTSAGAQSELQSWVDSTLGKLIPRADYGATYYPAQRVEGQPTDLQRLEHSFSLSVPLSQDARHEWAGSASVTVQDLDTHAILP